MTTLTKDRLIELFEFDEASGVFSPKRNLGRPSRSGECGRINAYGYREIGVDGRRYRAHRLAWLWTFGVMPSMEIDRINGVRDDNRPANLREVSPAVNRQNIQCARPRKKSGRLLGAFPAQRSTKWRSIITAHGVVTYLGVFQTEREAHEAYMRAKTRLHPESNLAMKRGAA